MSLNPLGVLAYEGKNTQDEETYRFRRGVESYPTVGDAVLLPTPNQLRSIVESGDFPAFILVDNKGNDFFKQIKPTCPAKK
jgi:hypothetical protein